MKTVVGLYDDLHDARAVVEDLVDAGFLREDISLVVNDQDRTYSAELDSYEPTDEVAEGAAVGAVTGGILGGVGGVLVGLGALAIPGIGPVVAAGPIVAGLVGAGVGAATGGLLGALVGWGIPEEHAQYYAEGVRRGGMLVAAKVADSEVDEAIAVMNHHNPVDVERRSEFWRQFGWEGYDPDAGPLTQADYDATAEGYRSFAGDPYAAYASSFRRHYRTHYANSGYDYDLYEPGYRFGYRLATDERFADYDRWEELELEARREWERSEQSVESTWDDVKDLARHAWEEVKDAFDYDDYDDDDYRGAVGYWDYRGTAGYGPEGGDGFGAYDEYDAAFRNHYEANFAGTGYGYERYRPAYRYGHALATDERNYGRDWNEILPEARHRWEETHEGAWEEFEDAVRHGWYGLKRTLS